MSSNVAPDRPPIGTERRPAEDSRHREWTGFGRRRRSPLRLALSLGLAAAAIILLYVNQPGWFSAPVAVVAPHTITRPTPAPQPSPTPKPQVRDPVIGGAHVDSGVRITLLGVSYTYGSGADEANKGNVYAVVRLRFENHSGGDSNLVPNINCQLGYNCHFFVRDNQGEKNPPVPYDPDHTQLRAVVLADSGYEEGSYTFEVPDHDRFNRSQPLQLLYYPNPLTAADTIYRWILQEPTRR